MALEELPPLPEGFTLDEPAAPTPTPTPAPKQAVPAALPPLPEGFTLDEPESEKGAFVPEVGKGLAAGAVESTGAALKGTAGQLEVARQAPVEWKTDALKLFDRIDSGDEDLSNVFDAELTNIAQAYIDMPPDKRVELRAGLQANLATAKEITPAQDVTETALYKLGQATQDWSAEQFAAAKDYEDSWTRAITTGLGSLGPTVAAALITKSPLGAGAVGYGMSGGEAIDRALAAGATPEQVMEVMKTGGLPGLTEQVPIETLFAKIPVGNWGRFAKILAKVGGQVLVEGGQEGLQQWMQNLIAKYNYDPDQDLGEGVLENAVIGGFVGGIAGAVAAPVTTRGKQKEKDQAETVLPEGVPEPVVPPGQPTPGGTGVVPPQPANAPAAKTEQAPPSAVPTPVQPAAGSPVTTVAPGQVDPAIAAAAAAPATAGTAPSREQQPPAGAAAPPTGAQPAIPEGEDEDVETAIPEPALIEDPEAEARKQQRATERKAAIAALGPVPDQDVVAAITARSPAPAPAAPAPPVPQVRAQQPVVTPPAPPAVTAPPAPPAAPEPPGTPEAAARRAQPQPPLAAVAPPAESDIAPQTLPVAAELVTRKPVETPRPPEAVIGQPLPPTPPAAAPGPAAAKITPERPRLPGRLGLKRVEPPSEVVKAPAAEPKVAAAKPAPAPVRGDLKRMLADRVRQALSSEAVSEDPGFEETVQRVAAEQVAALPRGVAPARAVEDVRQQATNLVREQLRERGEKAAREAAAKVEAQHARAREFAARQKRASAGKEKPAAAVLYEDDDAIRRAVKAEMAKPEAERDANILELGRLLEQRKKLKGGGKEKKLTEEEREEGKKTRGEQRAEVTEKIRAVQEKRAAAIAEREQAVAAAKPEPKPEDKGKAALADRMKRTEKVAPAIGEAIASVAEPNWDRIPSMARLAEAGRTHMQGVVDAVRAALDKTNERIGADVNVKLNSPEENLAIFARNQLAKRKGEPDVAKYVKGLLLLKAGDRAEFDTLFKGEQIEGTTGRAEEVVSTITKGAPAAERRAAHLYDAPPFDAKPRLTANDDIRIEDFLANEEDRGSMTFKRLDGVTVELETQAVHRGRDMLDLVGKESRVFPRFNLRGGFIDLISRMHTKVMKNTVGNIEIVFLDTDNMTKARGRAGSGGFYVWAPDQDPKIFIDAERFIANGRAAREHIILHEMTHAATVEAIVHNTNGARDIIAKLRKQMRQDLYMFQSKWEALNLKQIYALEGTVRAESVSALVKDMEFVAQAFSEPSFQQLMAATVLPDNLRAEVAQFVAYRAHRRPTWWNYFVNAVAKVLGYGPALAGRGQNYLEAVVAVYPELVSLEVQQRSFGKAVDVEPAPAGPALPPMHVLDMPNLIASVNNKMEEKKTGLAGMFNRSKRYLRQKTATTLEIERRSDRLWGGADNALSRYIKGVLKSAQQLRNAAREGNDILERMAEVNRKDPTNFSRGGDIFYDATVGEYNPMVPLTDPTNAHISKSGLLDTHRRENHKRGKAEWDALPADVRSVLRDWVEYLRRMEKTRVTRLVRNIVRQAEAKFGVKLPAGVTTDDVVTKVMNGDLDKKTAAEITAELSKGGATPDPVALAAALQKAMAPADEAIKKALGKTAVTLHDSKSMHLIRGLYVPLMRRGDLYFSGTHKVVVPTVTHGRVALDPTAKDKNVLIFSHRKDFDEYLKTAGTHDDRQIKGKPRIEYLDPATGENVGAKDVRGQPYYFVEIQNRVMETSDNEVELEALRLEYEANGFATSPIGSIERELNQASEIMPEQLQRLIRNMQQSSESDSTAKANVGALVDAYIRQLSGNRAAHRRVKRKGVKGFSRDLLRNSRDVNDAVATHVANLDIIPELAGLENAAQDYITRGHKRDYPTTSAEQLEREAQFNEVKHRLLKARSSSATMLHKPLKFFLDLSFIFRLFTPAYSVGNILGGLTTGVSVLAEKSNPVAALAAMTRAGSKLGVGGAFTTATRQFIKEGKGLWAGGGRTFSFHEDFIQKKLNPGTVERRFVDQLEELGLGVGAGLETAAVTELGSGVSSRVLNRWTRLARVFPEMAEAINRYLTGLAAVDLAKQRGLSDDEAIAYAIHAVERSQGGYGVENNPAYFNTPVLRVTLQFKKYAQMYAQLYYGAIAGMMGLSSHQTKSEAARLFAYLSVSNIILAGVFGAPLMEFARAFGIIASLLGGDDWEDWENWLQMQLANVTGETIAEMSTRGLSRGLGIDLSNRLGNDNLFMFGAPDSPKANDIEAWAFEMFVGAPGGMITEGLKKAWKGDFVGALPLPKWISDGFKAAGMVSEKPGAAAAKFLGFRPASEAREYEAGGAGAERKAGRKTKFRRQDIMGQYYEASPAEKQRIWRTTIREWNRTHRGSEKINYSNLQRSKRRRERIAREERANP